MIDFASKAKNELLDNFMTEAESRFSVSTENKFAKYQSDPVGFLSNEMNIKVTDDVSRMLNSVRDNRITLARSATGTGKSFGAAGAAIWFYKSFQNASIFTIANPYENQKILWSEISNLYNKNKHLFHTDKKISFNIERSEKDFIRALSVPSSGSEEEKEGRFSGKHNAHMLFIVDEGDTVPDFAYRGVEGCMSGGLIVRILILFNPRRKIGSPYRHEKRNTGNIIHMSAFNHPNVITGDHKISGAVDRDTTVQRINLLCRPLHKNEEKDTNTFKLPDFLVGTVAKKTSGKDDYFPPLQPGHYFINEQEFHYMVLGQYPPQGSSQLISQEWIDKARSRWDLYVSEYGEIPPHGTSATMGLDIGEFGSDPSVCCFRYGGYVSRLDAFWKEEDPLISAENANREYKKRSIIHCNVDSIGIGASVAPHMVRLGCRANPVNVANATNRKNELGQGFKNIRSYLLWQVREWLRADLGAMLPPDDELIEELLVPTYEEVNGKIEVMQKTSTDKKKETMRKLLKRSSNKMDSLCLTFYKPELLFPDLD